MNNLKLIANKYGVTVQNILEWNALRTTNIYVGQKLKIISSSKSTTNSTSSSNKKYYTIRSGDTLGSIAQRYNTTVSKLQKLNPKVNPRRMQIGQKIRVK